MLEVEVRSFITKSQYNSFLKFFKKKGKFLNRENQTTYYFSGSHDLRIQKNDNFAKLWLKGGKIHDKYREDIEVKCDKEDFEKLESLLVMMGFQVKIKWFRKRNNFLWEGTKVSVDFTRGYGYIIEFEKIVPSIKKEKTYKLLLEKAKDLGIMVTKREEFDKKFNYYKNNWKRLI